MQKEPLQDISISSRLQHFAVIIANPTAGGFPRHTSRLDKILTFLRHHGWKADLWLTRVAGHGQQLARAAVAQGASLIIAAGGDGTINEVIQELAGTDVVLGILPFGTANVWAREMGIPLDDLGACDVLLNGQTRYIDLGKVNGRYFFLMAGIGFDAEIVHAIEKRPFKRFGILSYALATLWLNFKISNFQVDLFIDDHLISTSAFLIIVGNTQLHAGIIKFTWQAKCDDGRLDVCVVRVHNMLERFKALWDFLLQRDQRRSWVHYDTCTSVKIHTNRPIAIQLDGEPANYTSIPTIFSIVPSILKVIVPKKIPEDVFTKE